MKKALTRLVAMIMATILLVTALPSTSALYVTTEWYSYTYNFNGRLGRNFWGQIPKFSTADGNIAYCIQENSDTFSANHSVSETYNDLSFAQQETLKHSLIYGYKGIPQYGYSDDAERIATQIMSWLIVYGWYNTGDEATALNIYTENMPSALASNVIAVYGLMKTGMLEHRVIPSFSTGIIGAAPTYELVKNTSGVFSATLNDVNDVLGQFNWTYAGVGISVVGNNMTITSATPISLARLSGAKTTSRYLSRLDYVTPVYLASAGNQDKVTIKTVDDPVQAYINVYAEELTGELEITKVFKHENGVIDGLVDYSGCTFLIAERGTSTFITAASSSAGFYSYTGTTSKTGATQFKLNSSLKFAVKELPADKEYDVYEVGAPTGYNFNANNSLANVRIIAGGTARATINNTRVTPRGGLEIRKTSEDDIVANMTFVVKGSDGSSRTIKTNSTGYGHLENLPVYTTPTSPMEAPKIITYTINENPVQLRYYMPAEQSNSLTANRDRVFNFHNVLKKGSLRIVKVSEDGRTGGVQFTITGDNGSYHTIFTNSNGVATLNNLPVYNSKNEKIIYTISETNVDLRYYVPTAEKITLVTDTATTVNVSNILKKGIIRIEKFAEDGGRGGITFTVRGGGYTFTMTTNATGTAILRDVPVYDSNNNKIVYAIFENDVPVRYVIPEEQTTEVVTDDTVIVYFDNILKKFRVMVYKSDSEVGAAQGNAKLSGAVYGIYNGGVLVDAYTTDKDGKFLTDYYVCGDNWTVKEITPSEGYLIDPTVHKVGAEAKDYTIEYNRAPDITSREQVMKGKIAIVKHTNQPDTDVNPENERVQQPEAGAQFEVFLQSAGSYANAQPYNRDLITTDENGYAQTKSLPYGVYTVKQIVGTDGYAFVEPFNVFISQNDKIYRYILENPVFAALIEIVKIDAETGEIIPLVGTGFKVKDLRTGKWIVQHINYPTPIDIDVYYTDVTGKLMLPQALNYGSYELWEVEAPYGYYLNHNPIPFNVDGTQTKLSVTMANTAQKGVITVTKNGEVFSSVEEYTDNGVTSYRPVYEEKGLAGARYNVIATEDIYTADGTRRAYAGQIVCTVTTDENGMGTSIPLYLGNYKVVEVEAPYGYVHSDTEHFVSLNYGGQEIEILPPVGVSFVNDRQKAKILLSKLLEADELFGIGMNGEYTDIIFGIYASSDISAIDGTMIPAGGLIETVKLNADLTAAFAVDLPLGSYYVKEIATDGHYILNDTEYPVVFDYAGQDTQVVVIEVNNGGAIVNTLKRGEIQGLKKGEDGEPLAGAVFGLFNPKETEFTETTALIIAVTDSDGVFSFTNIPHGQWIIREIEAPTGYVLDETPHIVEITENGQVIEIELENILIRGDIQGLKIGEDGEPLENAVFGLFNADETEFTETTALMTAVTDEDGIFSFTNLLFGRYIIREIEPPTGYVLNDTLYEVEIKEHKAVIEIEVENILIRGGIKGLKVGEDGEPLENAVFGLFKPDETEFTEDNALMTAVTDKDGVFSFTDIIYGQYLIREIEAPTGYVLTDTVYEVEITEDGQIIEIEIENILIRGEIQGLKKGEDGKPLAGAVFGLFNPNETEFTESTALMTAVSDEDGVFSFTDVLYGHYIVLEIKAPKGYVLNETPYLVEIKENAEIIEIDFENVLIRGEIRGLKKGDDGKLLSGAVFGLYNPDENVFTRESALMIAVSGEDGVFSFKDIPFGLYAVSEIEAPTGYILNDAVYKVEITEQGEVIEIEVINKKVTEPPKTPDIPNTGVDIAFAVVLAAVSLFMTAVFRKRRAKRKGKTK